MFFQPKPMRKFSFILFILFFGMFYSQKQETNKYYAIKKKYENLAENDSSAFRYLNHYIALAKKEDNYQRLVRGYDDAVFYSPSASDKLKYADSTLFAALKTTDKDLISHAYLGKGVVYYFNYKNYHQALDEYLEAYRYSENSDDEFLKNSILYHLGVVKSYLGYYDEALEHFKKTASYFETKSKENVHPNLIFNNKRGYYNSIHQMLVCYRSLKNYKAVDSLLNIGLKETQNNKDYQQEYGYFLKEKGIEEYRNKNYKASLTSLQESLKPISTLNDFAWCTVDYFYIGKSYLGMNDPRHAMTYFQKVDSVFLKHHFILPTVRENYELLISHYKKEKDEKMELYYTTQLLKADSVMSKDFSYLISTIHKKYDTQTLQKEKERLEKTKSYGIWIIASLILLALALTIILFLRYQKEKKIKKNYEIFEAKILNESNKLPNEIIKLNIDDKSGLSEALVYSVLEKLQDFEKNHEFIESNLTLNKLAVKFDTNSNYLSQVIKEYKGTNFTKYLGKLRIDYITQNLYNDEEYLSYKIETLAEKCGIASRTNFSNLFHEINGIRPTDFIKKRKTELEL